MPRQILRSLRKAIGLPASGDVAALTTMIRDLRCKAEASLGIKINLIPLVAVTPTLIALYEEDIVDAFNYTRLELASIYSSGRDVTETSAAFAGYGQGLCSTYTDLKGCKSELYTMPSEDVLSILYTRGALRTVYAPMHSAYLMFRLQIGWTQDWDLGFDARNEDRYWKRVGDALQYWKRTLPGSKGPVKVLLLGDSAGDKTFRSVLEESLRGTMAEMPVIFEEGSEFVAARGAAELARRSIYMTQNSSPTQELIGKELR
jgi:hypothetical protein